MFRSLKGEKLQGNRKKQPVFRGSLNYFFLKNWGLSNTSPLKIFNNHICYTVFCQNLFLPAAPEFFLKAFQGFPGQPGGGVACAQPFPQFGKFLA